MGYAFAKVDVWVGDILNRPGSLARVLEARDAAGADLEFLVARQVSRNTSRVFLSPLRTAAQRRAAADVGLVRAENMHSMRIEGPNKPGLAARISRALADAGLNIRGVSAARQNAKVALYFGFSSADDLKTAVRVAKRAVSGGTK